MSGSFLDTTVVVEIAQESSVGKTWAAPYVSANVPAEAPSYALRELLAGKISTICDAHNKVQAAENLMEAVLAFTRLPPIAGRKKDGAIQAIAQALKPSFEPGSTKSADEIKRETLGALALEARDLWHRARNLKGVAVVQALSCFDPGNLVRGDAKELRGPNDSWGCLKAERCAAAGYLFDKTVELKQMIDALHPTVLDAAAAGKQENVSRRRALRELQTDGPKEFNKGRCRALGDAYFAAMCPAGSSVITTNGADHAPLCNALKKNIVTP